MTDDTTKATLGGGAPKLVHALVDGKRATSFADMKPGAELSFEDEVRTGDVVAFGEERYRALRAPDGNVALEPIEKERDDG